MYFKNNIAVLQKYGAVSPGLAALLQEHPVGSFDLYATETGDFTIENRGICIHDPAGAELEAQAVVKAHCHPGADQVHLILGLGLGYLLDAVFAASPGKIMVYEPDLDLLRFVLENVDLSRYFESGRVYLYHTRWDMLEAVRLKIPARDDRLDVLTLPRQAALMQDEIPEIMQNLLEIVSDRLHDCNTLQHFHKRWIEAFFENIPHFADCLPLSALQDRFEGKPALIVSSGPSLDPALDAIDKLRDAVVLIAVNGAVRMLTQKDIIPDFAVFYDSNEMDRMLEGIPSEMLMQTTFLLGVVAQDICYRVPSQSKIYLPTENMTQLSGWLSKALGDSGVCLEGGGTVSLVAMQAAMMMSCNPIILVGQDLAFPQNRYYAGGIHCRLDESGMVSLRHQEDFDYFMEEKPAMVMGQDGQPMLSTRSFEGFIRHFEDIAEKSNREGNPTVFYNASVGGARINGYQLRDLHTFIGELAPWHSDKPSGFPEANPDASRRKERLRAALLLLQQDIESLVSLLECSRDTLSPYNSSVVPKLLDINRKLLALVQGEPLLSYLVMFELNAYDRSYRPMANSMDVALENVKAFEQFSRACLEKLAQHIQPCLEKTLQRLSSMQEPGFEPMQEPSVL